MILVPVALLLHTTVPPVHPVAVKVALAPAQMLVADGVTTGAVGLSPGVIVITFDVPLLPQTVLQYAL